MKVAESCSNNINYNNRTRRLRFLGEKSTGRRFPTRFLRKFCTGSFENSITTVESSQNSGSSFNNNHSTDFNKVKLFCYLHNKSNKVVQSDKREHPYSLSYNRGPTTEQQLSEEGSQFYIFNHYSTNIGRIFILLCDRVSSRLDRANKTTLEEFGQQSPEIQAPKFFIKEFAKIDVHVGRHISVNIQPHFNPKAPIDSLDQDEAIEPSSSKIRQGEEKI